jgi:putative ABC transport system permease protein
MQDIRAALRALARKPGFAAIAICTLAIGIGGNAAIFSIIDRVLLQPLPYPRPDRLVMPWEYSADVKERTGFDRLPSSPGDVTDFRTRNRTFQGLASMRAERVNLTGTGEPERIGAVRVSHEFLDVLGVRPVLGRGFSGNDAPGERRVLIGYRLWQRRFGSDPGILGRTILLNGEPATVLGVLPGWFNFPGGELPAGLGFTPNPEIWTLDILGPAQQSSRGGKSFALVGRLRDDATLRAAEADLGAIAADIARQHPASNAGWTIRVMPLREQLVGGVRSALLVLLTAVGFVLLIACVNVANLLLVRAASRQREMSVRLAIGADRRRLVRQLLVESLVLSVLAGAVGLFVAWSTLYVLLATSPLNVPGVSAAGLDLRVALFTLVVSVATGLAFGVAPAIQTTQSDVAEGLRDGTRGSVGSRRAHRMRHTLVVLEVALAVVLLVGAVLLTRTFVRLLSVDTGFRTEGVLTIEVALPRTAYPNAAAPDFFERLIARLSQVPGVQGAAVTSGLPLTGPENLRQITVEGRPRPEPGSETIADYRVITPEYFRIMGMPLLSGELWRSTPMPDAAPTLLVNATMAATLWPGENPIGKHLKLTSFDQPGPWFTVIGVVGDTRQTGLDSSLRPQVYVHQRTDPYQQMVVVLRTGGDPLGFAAVARAAVLELDRDQPVGRIRTMKSVVDESVANRRFTMCLVATFAVLALGLSLLGLYAVVSYSVAERTREMGVRLALGASPHSLLRLVLTEGLTLAAGGVAAGLAASFVLTRSMQSLLFGIAAHDATTFIVVPLLLLTASALGCLAPARRAMRVDPMVTLRTE